MQLLFWTALALTSCSDSSEQRVDEPPTVIEPTGELRLPPGVTRDWGDITEDGVLNVALPTDSTSYFLYRGEPMGLEYDVLEAFAESHELTLRVHRIQSREDRLAALAIGGVDIAGGRLTEMTAEHPELHFSRPIANVAPTLVQADADLPVLPPDVDAESFVTDQSFDMEVPVVERPAGLAGQEVWVQSDSEWIGALQTLEGEIGDVTVVGVDPDISTETLVRWVAMGRIPFTVASDGLADLSSGYYGNLLATPIIGQEVAYGFMMRHGSTNLHDAFDVWLQDNQEDVTAAYGRYVRSRAGYQERVSDNPLTGPVETLSDYDELFRALAPSLGWDWRLLASQAFQESRFDPQAQSWAGARGLLQLMPATAAEVGVTDIHDPTDNAQGAVRYLMWLDEQWAETLKDDSERLKFVLASYNAGMAHVQDAQRLTEKYGGDPNQWSDVAVWMLQLSRSEYYRDPVVEYGFCRGGEPVMYVDRILDRYEHYTSLVQG